MRIRILPYRQGSKSAKALAEALGGKVLKLQDSKYKYKPGDFVINWGNSNIPDSWDYLTVLNNDIVIQSVSNKLKFFNMMGGKGWLPPFWTNKDDIPDEDFPIVCRTVLNGHSGAGIVLAYCRADLVDAPLYVKYIKKSQEYRVHVGIQTWGTQDESITKVIAAQRKARKLGVPDEEVNWQVRNHQNGFVFVRGGFELPQKVRDVAVEALAEAGLDFGAVDVVETKTGDAYVLEINTAPGLEGQTIDDYRDYFKTYL